jgi:hypothetical protein
LGEDRGLVLEFHGKLEVWQYFSGLIEYLQKLVGDDTVIDVVRDPDLKKAGLVTVRLPATIDEALRDVADFGDVKVGGSGRAVRQAKLNALAGMLTEEFEKFTGLHESAAIWMGGGAGQLVDTAEKVFEAIAGERVVNVEATLFALDPAGIPHEGEVLRDRRKVATNCVVEFPDAARPTAQDLRKLKAGRVGEGLDHGYPRIAVDGQRRHYLAKIPISLGCASERNI